MANADPLVLPPSMGDAADIAFLDFKGCSIDEQRKIQNILQPGGGEEDKREHQTQQQHEHVHVDNGAHHHHHNHQQQQQHQQQLQQQYPMVNGGGGHVPPHTSTMPHAVPPPASALPQPTAMMSATSVHMPRLPTHSDPTATMVGNFTHDYLNSVAASVHHQLNHVQQQQGVQAPLHLLPPPHTNVQQQQQHPPPHPTMAGMPPPPPGSFIAPFNHQQQMYLAPHMMYGQYPNLPFPFNTQQQQGQPPQPPQSPPNATSAAAMAVYMQQQIAAAAAAAAAMHVRPPPPLAVQIPQQQQQHMGAQQQQQHPSQQQQPINLPPPPAHQATPVLSQSQPLQQQPLSRPHLPHPPPHQQQQHLPLSPMAQLSPGVSAPSHQTPSPRAPSEPNFDPQQQQSHPVPSPPSIRPVSPPNARFEVQSTDENIAVEETLYTGEEEERPVTPEQLPAEPAPPPALKSWASLFHRAEPSVTPSSPSSTAATYPPHDRLAGDKALAGNLLSTTFDNGALKSDDESSAADDSSGASVGSPLCKFLRDYSLNHKSPSLRPRGLTNRSNWCFANAILQALIACPPFYNLVKSLPLEPTPAEVTAGVATQHRQAMKIVSATFEFVDDFEVMSSNFPKLNRRDKGKKTEDLPLGKTFEPTSIYKMLLGLTSDTFKVMEGRQEDAEEFLTFLLNGLNDEMFAATKLPSDVALNGGAAESYDGDDTSVTGGEDGEGDDADEWKEVGPKNKGFVTRRQQTSMRSTPIGDIFQGQIRSSVQHSSGEPTATLQPFFTLQLDIQSENIRSVSDALVSNFGTESLDGYVCTATKKEVEAKRSLSLEELPPILILHLKRFIYSETSGGCQKVLKTIDFPVDLEVPKEIVSINSRNKYQSKKRQYKLFSVVYHNGTEATKGHYVTDVYHTGLAGWLRYDDSMVKAVNESLVLNHFANSVPYILCYRRCDTMVGLDKQNSK